MLIAVNTIGAPVEARLEFADRPGARAAQEAFSEGIYPVQNGAIRTMLKAYETKVFVIKNAEGRQNEN
jgi:hypothetical protein